GTITASLVAGVAHDAAGNNSAASTSTDNTISYDVTPPAAPLFTSITTDTGSSSTDRITSDQTLFLNGTAEANSTVTVTRAGTGIIGSTPANPSGGWSFNYTGTTLADGAYSFTAVATDGAGNTGPASAAFAVTVDTTINAPSTPALSPASPDGVTSDSTPTFTGTAEAGSTVRILSDGVQVGTGVATGGSFTITVTTPL